MSDPHIRYQNVYYIHEPSFPDRESIDQVKHALANLEASKTGQDLFRQVLKQRANHQLDHYRDAIMAEDKTTPPSSTNMKLEIFRDIPQRETLREDKLSIVYNKDNPGGDYNFGFDLIYINPKDPGTFDAVDRKTGRKFNSSSKLEEVLAHETSHSTRVLGLDIQDQNVKACEEARAIESENNYRGNRGSDIRRAGYSDPQEMFNLLEKAGITPTSPDNEREIALNIERAVTLNHGCTPMSLAQIKDRTVAVLKEHYPGLPWQDFVLPQGDPIKPLNTAPAETEQQQPHR